MADAFLARVRVKTETEAMQNALTAALQRNPFYAKGVDDGQRREIRADWATQILACVPDYSGHVSEDRHIKNIERICHTMSQRHRRTLRGGRMRVGTSQKALNLYLKFLWRLGKIPCPPHCPVDGVVLTRARLQGAWTKSDSVEEYKRWIADLRAVAAPRNLGEWEYDIWNKNG